MCVHKNKSMELVSEMIDGVLYVEEWRPVKGYENLYEISSFGRVKRLGWPYKTTGKMRPDYIVLPSRGKRRGKPTYWKVNLRKDTIYRSFSIHRLVGLNYIPLIEGKPEINHKTGDKNKNHYTQLEWCTHEENNEHAVRIGLAKRGRNIRPYIRKGRRIGLKKIIDIKTNEIFEHVIELSKKTGMSIKQLRRYLSGERYNPTNYRYVGEEHKSRQKPVIVKDIILRPVAKFDKDWKLIERFQDISEVGNSFTIGKVKKFLNGLYSNVDGFYFKEIAIDGSFIDPVKFISKRTPRPKSINSPTPSKGLIKYDLNGNEVGRFHSIWSAAKSIGIDRKNFRNALKKSSRGYCKGFIWKFIDKP